MTIQATPTVDWPKVNLSVALFHAKGTLHAWTLGCLENGVHVMRAAMTPLQIPAYVLAHTYPPAHRIHWVLSLYTRKCITCKQYILIRVLLPLQ